MFEQDRLHAVIVDDEIRKAVAIRKTLNFNRITDVDIVSNQEKVWEAIYESKNGGKKVDLIVTIPQNCKDYTDFKAQMELSENNLRQTFLHAISSN